MQWTSAPNIGETPLPQRARGLWKARLTAAGEALERRLEAERAQLAPWLAVGLGLGIAAWFALPHRLQWIGFLCLVGALALSGFTLIGGRAGRALGWFAAAATLGCALVWLRAERIAAPRLTRPIVAEVSGTVENVERLTARGQTRLTIAAVAPLPQRLRVSVDDRWAGAGLGRGASIRVRARLAPPPPMALPGTHDFARDFWFKGIGATGKALGPPQLLRPSRGSGLDRVRNGLRQHIGRAIDTREAGIAIALATGDQNAVGEDDAEAMRRSGLTHLLSVSGLHIAAVVGAAMLLALKLLALSERLALRFNLVLVSAGAGAAAGIFYTLLTGSQVPTVRSCIAALLVLAGIALGRDALSMRLIATGAIAVLLVRPEALAGASFQMSFAAVTAIVALHGSRWGRRLFERREEGPVRRFGRSLAAVAGTGLAVELALIPLALYHFHRSGLYGVAANIVAIPLTTFVIMPAEAGALLLDPIGMGAPMWWATERSIAFLLNLSQSVAQARGAVMMLPSMPLWAFGIMVSGGLWICLWNGSMRRWGIAPVLVGAAAAFAAPAPDLLITGDGRHLAIVRAGRAPVVLRERSGDFVRSLMAESAGFDGDPLPMGTAAWSRCSRDACVAELANRRWRLLATRSAQYIDWPTFVRACAAADIVVSDRRLPRGCNPRWLRLDRSMLQRTGGVAINLGPRPRLATVAQRIGEHPWRAGLDKAAQRGTHMPSNSP